MVNNSVFMVYMVRFRGEYGLIVSLKQILKIR